MMDYEEYFETMDYSEEDLYVNGFCPFSRKPCMGSDCQLSTVSDGYFYGCALTKKRRNYDGL